MEHTVLPWYQLSGHNDNIHNISNSVLACWASEEHHVCECNKANAKFIVKACNSHYELLRALKSIALAHAPETLTGADASVFVAVAKRAISKATGKEA